MIIKSIKLKNFRQFKDEQIIEFSTLTDKNVTIIHGENGSGKTTLLQAFLWCFYGENYINLTHKDMILNKFTELSMEFNDKNEIEVSIEFIHEKTNYFIRRTQNIIKEINGNIRRGEVIFKIKYLDENGNYTDYIKEDAENFINRIFPEKLSSYFFFDGERIKELGNNSRNGRKDLSQAVSNILGLDVLESAKKHINKVKNLFEKERISKFESNKINSLNDYIDKIEQDICMYNEKENELNKEKEELDLKIKRCAEKLSKFKESKTLQQKRENIEKEIHRQTDRINYCREDIFKNFNDKAYLFFAKALFLKTKDILSEYKVEDKQIEGLSGRAIDFVLQRGKCFCGKELTVDCPEYKIFMDLKKYLPPQSFGVLVGEFNRKINSKLKKINKFKEEMNSYNDRFIKEELYLDQLTDQLTEVNKSIEGINFEAIKLTEKDYREKRSRREKIISQEIPAVKAKIINLKEKLESSKKEREQSIIYDQKNILINKRIKVCEELRNKFELYLTERESEIRDTLKERVKEIFNSIIHKDYFIDIDEKYRFDVVDENGITVPMSEGERQVTSLSFIAGLIDLARNEEINERLAKNTGYNSREMYPLVMDSPFGSLDSEHRRNVAISIPKLSEQVIIFVSSTQWEGQVEKEIKQVVGKEYCLDYNKEFLNNISVEYTNIKKVGE
ncbi:hypothetical protein Z969_10170 [Clostridium novyi A str. 4570]|uniref:Nuclease SbcCD subunit C n=1 Tax=Clostridium novyi A str. 4570 TaxID=1444290 RepID=A0AA88ZN14_CLONO|nr:AAA family ATPase [Clostridium novyi]KGN00093.1 hypothetical protein Z969_10170 [Clostridium novyi A str. 4570]